MFNPLKGQWWNEPPGMRRYAFYMTLRVHYRMDAQRAWFTTKESFRLFPELMTDQAAFDVFNKITPRLSSP